MKPLPPDLATLPPPARIEHPSPTFEPQGELIDAGRSAYGWSLWGSSFYCLQLYAHQKMGTEVNEEDHFTRGSMFHTAAGHHLARAGATQGGCWVNGQWEADRDRWLNPYDAVTAWTKRHNKGSHLIDLVTNVFDRWMRQEPAPPYRVASVETERCLMIGHYEGVWGLWPVAGPVAVEDEIDRLGGSLLIADGGAKLIMPHVRTKKPIVASVMNVPGHLRHGRPVLITRRLDVEVVGATVATHGKYDNVDHKSTTTHVGEAFAGKYVMDGGWSAFRIMGRELYGASYGKCYAHVVQCRRPYKRFLDVVDDAPWADATFAEDLWETAHRVIALELSGRSLWRWPKARHETVCTTMYGRCGAYRHCRYGPGNR